MQLSSEVAELTSAFESLSAQQRKLAARVGMREVRQRREEAANEPSPDALPTVAEKFTSKEELRQVARAKGFRVP